MCWHSPWSRVCLHYCLLLLVTGLMIPVATFGQDSTPADRIDPAGIHGSLVISGGGRLPATARQRFLALAGGSQARLVVIPTARDELDDIANPHACLRPWLKEDIASICVVHTRLPSHANRDDILAPLRDATAVWIDGGSQSRIADAFLNTAVEWELMELLNRGGVIGGTSAGAAVMSRVMIAQGNPIAEVRTGFDLLPGCVIDQHFTERNRKPRLSGVIASHPRLFGMGIDEGTAVIVRGRTMDVIGDGGITICLAQSADRAVRDVVFKAPNQTDLTRWRLAALARTQPPFPPSQAAEPKVSSGSLVIVGGGGMTADMVNRFIELAGGPESTIVVLPTASPDQPDPSREGRFFVKAGCKDVVTLSARKLEEVSSPEFLATLKKARGVWFGGGRQWHFVDVYAGTPAVDAFHDVLRRGGVIGGSSAGATIQGEYLVRGSPQGNQEMMAEGYERGFGFLPGCAIDQHFTQRKRLPDMLAVMSAHPQLLGIGLDETTAIIVQGSVAEVIGKNKAHFFDASNDATELEPKIVTLESGSKYDLTARTALDKPAAAETKESP